MAIESLYDHRVEVWRATVTKGPLNEREETWEPVDTTDAKNAAFSVPSFRLGDAADDSPGSRPSGQVTAFLDRRLDVQADDVLKVLTGPEAGTLYRCHHPSRPRGNHWEVPVEVWEGRLPEEES
ncbi:MAG: hypothetical protein ACOC92_02090 [bacterium]